LATLDPPAGGLDDLDAEHLRLLIRVSHELNSTLEIDTLLPQVLDLVMDTTGAEGGSLWLLDGQTLRCHVARGSVAEVLPGVELPLGAGIVGDAVRRRTSVVVEEVREDSRFLHQIDELSSFQTQSVIAVPLICRGEVLGGIEVLNERADDGVFGAEHRYFLEALADDAAAAIRNARLFETERQARDLAALLEVSREIGSTFDMERILVSVVNLAGRTIPFDRCLLALWKEERLEVRAISGEASVDRRSPDIREVERFLLWAAEGGGELHVPDVHDSEDEGATRTLERFGEYLGASGVREFFMVAVQDAEGKLGALLFEFHAPHTLGEWGREAATLLANQTALALRNAQLYTRVPFISWLEPLAEKRQKLAGIAGGTWLRWGVVVAAVFLSLVLVRFPLRLAASDSTVRAAVQQPVRAPIGGIVDLVLAREGQHVEAGTPVFHLRDEELLRRLLDAEAGRDLAEREALSASARGDVGGAALADVRATGFSEVLSLLRLESSRAEVLAPTSGIVLTPRLHEMVGSYVSPGQPLSWIGDPASVELEMRMPQADLGEIRVGDRVRARVSAHPTVTFEGRVVSIAPRAETLSGTTTFAVRALLDNREGLLRPGMAANAKVVTQPRPLASFVFRRPWRWVRMNVWW
jgi:GAF domain-containing protein/multidrug efflux pump subunit AcrA (membrane-fusion protein)